MAFHHGQSHGHLFHGLEARDMLHMEKRDFESSHIDQSQHGKKKPGFQSSHRDLSKHGKPDFQSSHVDLSQHDNKMRFIHNRPKANLANKEVVATVFTQVFVTQSKTFDGAYTLSTATGHSQPSGSLADAEASYASAKSAANAVNTVGAASSSAQPTHIKGTPLQHSSTSQFVQSTAVVGTPLQHSTTADPTVLKGTPLSATQTSDSNVIGQKTEGMSAGAKAGLGFGIILAIALCGGLIFFCWRRRKNQLNQEGAEKLVDEKHASQNSFFGGTAAAVGAPAGNIRGSVQSQRSTRTASTAPRLSLRPVTQFLPNIMDSRKSTGNALDVPQMSEKPKSAWERRPQGAQQNPFDDAAIIDEKQARSVSPVNPFEEGDGVVAAGAVAGSNKGTPTHSQKNSWEGSEPPTPKSTKFGTAAAVPITTAGAANGAQMRGPNNVHRVQLDFKPSMEDELELRSGQLVRMLHEYDDGWCLCIRMDRSQQGVCPRTCLSKLPVKPRPQGPPPQNGPPGRPMGPPPPGMRRPASPAMNHNMVPRPLTPTGRERSHTNPRNSPAPQESRRPRSQSVGGASERPMSPAGVPARKPVPGQAM